MQVRVSRFRQSVEKSMKVRSSYQAGMSFLTNVTAPCAKRRASLVKLKGAWPPSPWHALEHGTALLLRRSLAELLPVPVLQRPQAPQT